MRRLLSLLLMVLPLVVWAEQTAVGGSDTKVEDKSPALVQMEALAEEGIKEALKALQRSGGFYPFAMVINSSSGKVHLAGYSGDPEAKPPADDFAVALFLQLREQVKVDQRLIAAVVLKPFHAPAEDGKTVPGVWAAVDHRDEAPWVMFQPLIEHQPGRYMLGQIIYQESEEAIFPASPE